MQFTILCICYRLVPKRTLKVRLMWTEECECECECVVNPGAGSNNRTHITHFL